jgi:hypothetical protein
MDRRIAPLCTQGRLASALLFRSGFSCSTGRWTLKFESRCFPLFTRSILFPFFN